MGNAGPLTPNIVYNNQTNIYSTGTNQCFSQITFKDGPRTGWNNYGINFNTNVAQLIFPDVFPSGKSGGSAAGLGLFWNEPAGSGILNFICYGQGAGGSGLSIYATSVNLDITKIASFNTDITGSSSFNMYGSITAASFNTTSDYRIKENVNNLNNVYSVDNLRPVEYENTLINKKSLGFIAHEVQEQYPFIVNGEKDGKENQSINYQEIIPILVKEIQDLKKRVTILEN